MKRQLLENGFSNEQMDSSRQGLTGNPKTLQKYKKRLLVQVIAIFAICLVIILERVFYQVIVEEEETLISKIQVGSGFTDKQNDRYFPDAIGNAFWRLFADLSDFYIQFLLLTHFLATMFVAYNSFIAAKVMYVSMGIIYLVSVIQMFYTGSRPFWDDSSILSASCLPSYTHPNLGLILLLIVPAYFYYCSKKKVGRAFLGTIPQRDLVLGTALFLVILLVQFTNYILGLTYIINITMSLIFAVLIFMSLVAMNTVLEKLLKKSTVLKTDAKKYVFYWLLMICLLETFVLIVYSGQDLFMDIEWVQNYMECTKYLDYERRTYRFDEVIGPWFNFTQTAAVFGWIGGIFGISATYRKIETFEWYAGPMRQRLYRILLTNLFIVPSWLFVLLLQEKGDWVRDIGLNNFIVDGVHFFVLYFWIFGYMPILILHKALKLTYKDEDEEYVILQTKA